MQSWQLDAEQVAVHAPKILRSDDSATRAILLVLPQGERLDEHQVHEHALVLVLAGEVAVDVDGQEQEFGAHALLHFDPAERHALRALGDARILLLLSPWPGEGHPSRADG
jgi:quercetin dioxygenase-like cupin family protein